MRWANLVTAFFGVVYSVLPSVSGEEPSLSIKSRSSVFNVGEQKAIFCEGKGVTEPVEWFYPSGEQVPHGSSLNKRVHSEPKSNLPNLVPLIIHSTKLEDSGNWTCRSGDLSVTIEITVGSKVVMPMRNQKVVADEGSQATLYCEAKGYPQPVVQWYLNNVPITDTPDKYALSVKEDNYTLVVQNLEHYDSGEYVCKVTQKALSHYTDKTITLEVHHKPIIFDPVTNEVYKKKEKEKERVEEVFAVLGDTKNITCNALARPLPRFRWYKVKNNYQKDLLEKDLIILSPNGVSSTLILRMNSEADSGTYRCIADNPKGHAIVNFDVTPGRKPDPPNEINAVSRNDSFIIFNVTCYNCTLKAKDDLVELIPENLPIDGYSFHLIPHNKEFEVQDWTQLGDSFDVDIEDVNVTLFPVGPLQNKTVFHARVRSRNAAGYSDWLEMPGTVETTNGAARLAATSSVVVALFALIF